MSDIRLVEYKFNDINIPISQTFRSDEYKNLFPNVKILASSTNQLSTLIAPSFNDIRAQISENRNLSRIYVSFDNDIDLTLYDIGLYFGFGCPTSRWGLARSFITKINNKSYIINLPLINAAVFVLAICKGLVNIDRQSVINRIPTYEAHPDHTIYIPILPQGALNYGCFRESFDPSTTPITTPTPTLSNTCSSIINPQFLEFIGQPNFDIIFETHIAQCHKKCIIIVEIYNLTSGTIDTKQIVVPHYSQLCGDECLEDKGISRPNKFYTTLRLNDLIIGNNYMLTTSVECV